jgi:hypothetical protein
MVLNLLWIVLVGAGLYRLALHFMRRRLIQ